MSMVSDRMHLFKNGNRCFAIRDTFRKKCAERLREKRMYHFNSRRHIENVIQEVSTEFRSDIDDLDENAMLELYDSITNSLIQEQYDDLRRIEEERLAADVDEFMNPSVYCPSCLLSPLSVDGKSAKCQGCPFLHHFDSTSTPPTQYQLRQLLSESFMTHEATKCGLQPRAVEIKGRLVLHCEDCGFNMVII